MNRELSSRRVVRALAALASIAFVSLALVACEEDLRASDYDQTCDVASDCVGIETGRPSCCGFTSCEINAAINKADLRQYESDFEAAESATCGGGTYECPLIACEKPPPVACVSGRCEVAKRAP